MKTLCGALFFLLLLPIGSEAQSITVTWQDMSLNEDNFIIERRLGQAGSFFDIAHPTQNIQSFTDTQLIANQEYCYHISAGNSAGQSVFSNIACGMVTAEAPNVTLLLSSTTIPEIPATGLVLAMLMNEGSGPTAQDTSGKNNVGTISGATWTPNGKYGAALSFDGVNDVVTIPDAPSLDLSVAVTIEAWVYPTVIPSSWKAIAQKQTDAYLLMAGSNSGAPSMGGTLNGTCCTHAVAPTRLPVNTWTHVAGTYDGAMIRLYLNGAQVASKPATGSLQVNANPLRIGGNTYGGEFFQGRIDEVRIYNYPLTQAQIQGDMVTPAP